MKNLDEVVSFGDAGPTDRGTKIKCVFRVSFDNDMKLKFKARLVFCGYSQIYGVDYKDTYAPTVPVVGVFIMFFISGKFRMHNSIFDVTAVFLVCSVLMETIGAKYLRLSMVRRRPLRSAMIYWIKYCAISKDALIAIVCTKDMTLLAATY